MELLSGAVSSCLRSEVCCNLGIFGAVSPSSGQDLTWRLYHSVLFHRPGYHLQYTGLLGSPGAGVGVSGRSPMVQIGSSECCGDHGVRCR